MDEQIFIAIVLFYVSLYKTVSPTFVYDAEGNCVSCPICIKTNRGAGRQSKIKQNLTFRHDMHTMGLHIGPGLTHLTAPTQEMHNVYKTCKNMCDAAAQDVFTRKTSERGLTVEKCKQTLKVVLVNNTGKNDQAAVIRYP